MIDFVQTAEGRATPSGSVYSYDYMLKDHLGNTRVLIKQNGSILDINDYYAFGLEIGDPMGPSPDNNYKYNGKEWNTDLSLNAYDYGARFYDPIIGRWNVVDPLAEKFYSLSTYNYTDNNPVNNTDPDGMDIIYGTNSTTFTGADAEAAFSSLKNSQQGNNGGGDDDKKKKKEPSIGKQLLDGTPVVGKALSSGDKLAAGDYLGSVADFGTALTELFTLGLASEVKLGTSAITQTIERVAANQGTEIIAANGVKIEGFVGHAVERAIERGVKPAAILNALKNPLKIGKVVVDNLGRQSQRLIGQSAEVVVNPQTGRIISVNPTSSAKAAKLITQIAQ